MAYKPTVEQARIIEAPVEARILVEAGAGAGKTEVVARRIAHLLRSGLKPREVLVLSFSRAAVRVLAERLRKVANEGEVEELRWATVRTFDSWAFRLLRELGGDPRALLSGDFNQTIGLAADTLRTGGPTILTDPRVKLGDLRHVIVDEIQDLTGMRAALVLFLLDLLAPHARSGRGFTLLGDSCQSIYDWTAPQGSGQLGARDLREWVVQAYGAHLQRLPLTGNRRSTPAVAAVLEGARSCLEEGTDPDQALTALRELLGNLPGDDLAGVSQQMSSSSDTMAILCRDNGQVLRVAKALYTEPGTSGALPALNVLAGNPPKVILPAWIAQLFSRYEGSQISKTHFSKLFRALGPEGPCGGNAEIAWRMLMRFARSGDEETALSMDALRERVAWPDSLPDDEGERYPAIVLTTVHQSKGREFDRVRILASDDEVQGDRMEAARVIYVALSRARADLQHLHADTEPLFNTTCWYDRKRWHCWRKVGKGAQHDLELGREGDIEPESIIRSSVVGSDEDVRQTQEWLTRGQSSLIGLDVTATKVLVSTEPLRVAYRVHGQHPERGRICLGQFADAVRQDLQSVTHAKQGLPKNIYKLRVRAVTTCTTTGELPADVPAPWRDSKLWLGLSVHGLGEFVTFWKN